MPSPSLTDREREILSLIADGLSNRQIAHRLILAPETVKWYNKRIFAELAVHNRTRAATRARELGLLHYPDQPPAPRHPTTQPPNNLPAPVSSFVGRRRELSAVRELLADHRLLTITGPAGSGKTRLALQAVSELLHSFTDGIWFVELAPLADPTLLASAVASTLGMFEYKGRLLLDGVVDYLRERQLLLLLDNCEHLVEATAQLAETLLRRCPELRILATSREALGIMGEAIWLVQALSLPGADEQTSVESLCQYDAVQLFVERAQAVLPAFRLTGLNAASVAKLCRQLDGMPLAIELAAARVGLLRVQQIVARLDDRFRLLTSGSRTAPPRHQTLQALIDWSHDLLLPAERRLLRRLSVFSGSFVLEAVEDICDEEAGGVVLESLTQLVNKSLVVAGRASGEETRYDLHETIAQYARTELERAGEAVQTRERHAEYYCRLTEEMQPKTLFYEQIVYPHWWEKEYGNLRAVLCRTLIEHTVDVELGLSLAAWLAHFWIVSGQLLEGRHWLEAALRHRGEAAPLVQAKLCLSAGNLWLLLADDQAAEFGHEALLVFRQLKNDKGIALALELLGRYAYARTHDFERAAALLEESLALSETLDDRGLMVGGHFGLARIAMARGHWDYVLAETGKGLALAREINDKNMQANLLRLVGRLARRRRDYPAANIALLEGLALAEELKAKMLVARLLNSLGEVVRVQGQLEQAEFYYQQALRTIRECGDRGFLPVILDNLGQTVLRQGDPRRAELYLRESLNILRAIRSKAEICWNFCGWAAAASAVGETGRATRLLASAQAIGGIPIDPVDRQDYESLANLLRARQGEAAFATAWAEGQAMSLEEAIAYALEQRV